MDVLSTALSRWVHLDQSSLFRHLNFLLFSNCSMVSIFHYRFWSSLHLFAYLINLRLDFSLLSDQFHALATVAITVDWREWINRWVEKGEKGRETRMEHIRGKGTHQYAGCKSSEKILSRRRRRWYFHQVERCGYEKFCIQHSQEDGQHRFRVRCSQLEIRKSAASFTRVQRYNFVAIIELTWINKTTEQIRSSRGYFLIRFVPSVHWSLLRCAVMSSLRPRAW